MQPLTIPPAASSSATPAVPAVSQVGQIRRVARERLLERLSLVTLLMDQVMVILGFMAALWLRFYSGVISLHGFDHPPTIVSYGNLIALGSAFMFFGLLLQNMYQQLELMQPWRVVGRLFGVNLICLFAFIGISLVAKTSPGISRLFVFFSFLCIFVFIFAWRLALSRILHQPKFAERLHQRVVFIGWNDDVDEAYRKNNGKLSPIFEIVGLVTTSHFESTGLIPQAPSLGCVYQLETLFEHYAADVAVVADRDTPRSELLHLANVCEQAHVQFALMPQFFEVMVAGLRANYVAGLPVLSVTGLPLDRFTNQLIKRAADVVGAMIGLILSVPVIVVFGALVFVESPGPIFYGQVRTGRKGHQFKMYKIRSMRIDAEAAKGAQWTQENDPRRLRVGAFMRKFNIDEVPQFWNVLKGDMSLVGPRPERPELIKNFKCEIPHYNARHGCLPGLTGWAQVNGWRGNTSLEQRIRHDIWYLENWSLWLDIKIMFLTFIRRDNAY
jgi:exopolysaccharide biosynthesis polyprenyl glycosylphosphotransferase